MMPKCPLRGLAIEKHLGKTGEIVAPAGHLLTESDVTRIETAAVARRLGQEPRVAFLSYSNFGNPEFRCNPASKSTKYTSRNRYCSME
jgi:hypothetical protein